MNHLNRRGLFVSAAAAFAAAGCADIVGPPPSPKLYVLEPHLPHDLAGPKVDWALSIQEPNATAGLDSRRIAIIRPPASLDYYADAAWADQLPDLAQASLVQSFEACGRIAAVSRDSEGAQADYLLSVDLRDFEARYDRGEAAPLAVVRLGVRLVETRTRRISGYVELEKEVRASANAIEAAVEALGTAFSGVLFQLVPWVLNRPNPV